MRKKIAVACAALALPALAASMTQAASAPPEPRIVKVRDNFFAPDALTVPKDTKIVWRWPSRPGDVHDVYLTRRPEGARRFRSRLVASDFSFARKLRKPGRYRIVCTIHAAMTMSVKVRR